MDSLNVFFASYGAEGEKKFHVNGNNGVGILSPREMECFLELLKNQTLKEVAQKLEISDRTVEHHLSNINHKLGVLKRSELYEIAKNNLLLI